MVGFKRRFLIQREHVTLRRRANRLSDISMTPEVSWSHPPTSWLCLHRRNRNIMVNVPSPRSITTGPKLFEVKISFPHVVHCRTRGLGIALVHVIAAKHQTSPYNVSSALRLVLRFAYHSIAPSLMNGAEHVRSSSPDPLPVPPRHNKNGYRGDRTPNRELERYRSHRGRDYDRSYSQVHGREVRTQGSALLSCGVTHTPCAARHQPAIPPPDTGHFAGERVSRSITGHIDSLQHPDFQFSRCTGRKRALCVSLSSSGAQSIFLCS